MPAIFESVPSSVLKFPSYWTGKMGIQVLLSFVTGME